MSKKNVKTVKVGRMPAQTAVEPPGGIGEVVPISDTGEEGEPILIVDAELDDDDE